LRAALGGFVSLLCGAWAMFPISWDSVHRRIRHDFPDVPQVTTEELARQLREPGDRRPLLLDVRTEAEFSVSHLNGARRIEPGSSAAAVGSVDKTRPIVTYCSVGYRSAAFAEELRHAGYSEVRNLDGSIFQWANEGRPLFRDGRQVRMVHPYDSRWGALLKPEYRSEPN
jgi:rhodanese-related sulfurtransferase